MSLKYLHKITKTIGFKLTVWYSAIFILSSLFLFIISYFFLYSSFQKQDREAILLALRELSSLYEIGGISALEKEVRIEKKFQKKTSFFIRVAGSKNKTLFISLPYQWLEFDIKKLEKIVPNENGKLMRLPSTNDEYVLEVASTRLADGHWLQVGKSTEDQERLLGRFREIFAAVMFPLVLLGFVSGSVLAFRALRPIRHLIRTVQSIEIGKKEVRVPSPRTGDELDELVRLFNEMLGKIETLIHAMRASLDNVAHDLRTPLTRLRGIAEVALQSGQNVEVCREALTDCIEESERIITMLNTIMDISEAETGAMKLHQEVVNISALIEVVVDIYCYVTEEKGIVVHKAIPKVLNVRADSTRMSQVLGNLLDNAIKYTLNGGQIHIEAYQRQRQVVITVKDTGLGIPQEQLPRIWDRLYRGDQSRSQKGLGLGLSLVKAIVQAHNGRVDAFSEPGKGSTFTIYLPSEN
jgi:signal transduction histidine kinase